MLPGAITLIFIYFIPEGVSWESVVHVLMVIAQERNVKAKQHTKIRGTVIDPWDRELATWDRA